MKEQTGLTLVEMLLAVAVFSIIAVAAMATVAAQARLERGVVGRLEAIGSLQQASHQIVLDLRQGMAFAAYEESDCLGGANPGWGRALAVTGRTARVAYCLYGDALYRREGSAEAQRLAGDLDGVVSRLEINLPAQGGQNEHELCRPPEPQTGALMCVKLVTKLGPTVSTALYLHGEG